MCQVRSCVLHRNLYVRGANKEKIMIRDGIIDSALMALLTSATRSESVESSDAAGKVVFA